jgi:hypothetical protein
MVQANEYGGGRPWHKRVLIPFWLIQILFMGLTIVSASLNIWATSSYVNQVNAGNFNQIASGNFNINGNNADGVYISTNTTGADGYSYSTSYSVSGAIMYVKPPYSSPPHSLPKQMLILKPLASTPSSSPSPSSACSSV